LARLDDRLGKGEINKAKKWWWDLEMVEDGGYGPAREVPHARALSKDLDLKYEDQTLAVYPAPLAPPPYNYPFPMDREAGIKAYADMIPAAEHKRRRAAGLAPEHIYTADQGESPVLQVVVSKVEAMTDAVTKYEFAMADGSDMPPVEAGAHIDVVVAPEFFRQYSLSGDPADRSSYQIAVLREDQGKGGSKLMHRIFEEGRRIFISRPINNFPLHEDARFTYLMGGGIGITPLIAMAHRLHSIGADFGMHYSCSSHESAGFLNDLREVPWASRVHLHFSNKNTRADLPKVLKFRSNAHVYTCGPDAYMASVMQAAEGNGFPEDCRHLEYFTVPEQPDYVNHDFALKLARSDKTIQVKADQTPADALLAAGIRLDLKCSDGLCGVCKCTVLAGEVEHRDFVLSNKDRATQMILCQSRAAQKDGLIEIDL
jgi:ferredoxin-NADP reductase